MKSYSVRQVLARFLAIPGVGLCGVFLLSLLIIVVVFIAGFLNWVFFGHISGLEDKIDAIVRAMVVSIISGPVGLWLLHLVDLLDPAVFVSLKKTYNGVKEDQ